MATPHEQLNSNNPLELEASSCQQTIPVVNSCSVIEQPCGDISITAGLCLPFDQIAVTIDRFD
jgi:hypothetical protein